MADPRCLDLTRIDLVFVRIDPWLLSNLNGLDVHELADQLREFAAVSEVLHAATRQPRIMPWIKTACSLGSLVHAATQTKLCSIRNPNRFVDIRYPDEKGYAIRVQKLVDLFEPNDLLSKVELFASGF